MSRIYLTGLHPGLEVTVTGVLRCCVSVLIPMQCILRGVLSCGFVIHDTVPSLGGLSDELQRVPRRHRAAGHGPEGQQARVRLPAELHLG